MVGPAVLIELARVRSWLWKSAAFRPSLMGYRRDPYGEGIASRDTYAEGKPGLRRRASGREPSKPHARRCVTPVGPT